MHQNSTSIEIPSPAMTRRRDLQSENNGGDSQLAARPRRSTLAFIRQFARCYQPQTRLQYPLSEIVLN